MIEVRVAQVVNNAHEVVVVGQLAAGSNEVVVLANGQRNSLVLHTINGEHANAGLGLIVRIPALDRSNQRARGIQLGRVDVRHRFHCREFQEINVLFHFRLQMIAQLTFVLSNTYPICAQRTGERPKLDYDLIGRII